MTLPIQTPSGARGWGGELLGERSAKEKHTAKTKQNPPQTEIQHPIPAPQRAAGVQRRKSHTMEQNKGEQRRADRLRPPPARCAAQSPPRSARALVRAAATASRPPFAFDREGQTLDS